MGDSLNHIAKIERLELFGHANVEDNLQQQVAQFLAQIVDVVALDRVMTSNASSSVYGAMDLKSCSRSQGQPVTGVRKAADDIEQAGYLA